MEDKTQRVGLKGGQIMVQTMLQPARGIRQRLDF